MTMGKAKYRLSSAQVDTKGVLYKIQRKHTFLLLVWWTDIYRSYDLFNTMRIISIYTSGNWITK